MPAVNDKETIKNYFIFLYNQSGLSKTDFAKELGVSQPVVSNILTGGRDVSSNIIKNVYLKYDINLETIVDKKFNKVFILWYFWDNWYDNNNRTCKLYFASF